MKIIVFTVASTSGNSYKVTFKNCDQVITSTCSCAAGEHGQLCKHRFEILHGDISAISSGNENEAAELLSWLHGTSIAEALMQISEAEANYENAKKKLSSAKKHLSRLLNG